MQAVQFGKTEMVFIIDRRLSMTHMSEKEYLSKSNKHEMNFIPNKHEL